MAKQRSDKEKYRPPNDGQCFYNYIRLGGSTKDERQSIP